MRVLGRSIGVAELGGRLCHKYSLDAVGDSAAALSYYFIFSLFPFLLFVTALIAYLPLQTPMEHLVGRVRPMVPAQVMALVEKQLRELVTRERPQLLTFGLLGSFWSASRGVDALRRCLNLAHGIKESRPLWKTELVTWVITLSGALLLLVAAAVLVAGGGLGLTLAGKLGIRVGFLSLMRGLRWPVLGLTFMTAAGLAYRFLPDIKGSFRGSFRFIAPGAAVGGSLWVLATWGFGLYVAAFGTYHLTYGTLGGVMILLTWLYLSGFIMLAGGELNAALEHVSTTTPKTAGHQARARRHVTA
jgi:membrane protein